MAHIEGLQGAFGNFYTGVATGEGAVWTSNIQAGSVSRIDPATNKVVTTIPVWPQNVCGPDAGTTCSRPAGIATTPGAVWVALHHEWSVVRIDPATNKVVATIPIGAGSPPEGPGALVAANGAVYINGNDPSSREPFLERIDPETNTVTRLVATSASFCGKLAADGTHVWLCGDDNSVADADVASGSIVERVGVGAPPFFVSFGLGSVWTTTAGNELLRIDPATHTITGRLSFPAGPGDGWMEAGEGAVWLARQNVVYRIEQ